MCLLLLKDLIQVFEGCMFLKTRFLVPGLNENIAKHPSGVTVVTVQGREIKAKDKITSLPNAGNIRWKIGGLNVIKVILR